MSMSGLFGLGGLPITASKSHLGKINPKNVDPPLGPSEGPPDGGGWVGGVRGNPFGQFLGFFVSGTGVELGKGSGRVGTGFVGGIGVGSPSAMPPAAPRTAPFAPAAAPAT